MEANESTCMGKVLTSKSSKCSKELGGATGWIVSTSNSYVDLLTTPPHPAPLHVILFVNRVSADVIR